MFQHFFTVFIFAQFKDIKPIILTIGSPVILRRLERVIHLIQPCTYQSRIFGNCSYYTASTVISTGKRTILRSNISCISSQCRKRNPILKIIDIGNIPAEAYTVTSGFSFGYISGPFLSKCLRIDQTLFIQRMQPCDTIFKSLLCCRTDDFQIVSNRNMSSLICITVTFSEAIDEDTRILTTIIYDTGHRNDTSINIKFCLQFRSMVTERNQNLFKFIYSCRHFQSKEIQPFFIDEAHIINSLNCGLF